MPEISVIVPVYNVEPYLNRCVDSILGQTFTDFELLLVDDGTPDNSGDICDEYSMLDNRVISIHKPNGGVSSARNYGIDVSCGTYMTFIDSDDYVIDKYLSEFSYHDVDLVCQSAVVVNENGGVLYTAERKEYLNECVDKATIEKLIIDGSFNWTHCKIYRSEIALKNNVRFDTSVDFAEDTLFTVQFMMAAKSVRVEAKYNYRYVVYKSRETLSNSYSDERIKVLCEANKIICNCLFFDNQEKRMSLFSYRMKGCVFDCYVDCIIDNRNFAPVRKIKACFEIVDNKDIMDVFRNSEFSTVPPYLKSAIELSKKKMIVCLICYYELCYFCFRTKRNTKKIVFKCIDKIRRMRVIE